MATRQLLSSCLIHSRQAWSSASWSACSQQPGLLRFLSSNPALSASHVSKLLADLSAPPSSLQFDGRTPAIPQEVSNSFFGKLAIKLLMYEDKHNQLIVGGQQLYDAIQEQVDDGALQRAFGMDPEVFYSTYTLLAIHVWLVFQRLGHRTDSDIKYFRQRFYNHFQHDVERRIYKAGVQVGVSKWARKLEAIFYSSSLSFDKVLRREGSETIEDVMLREFFGNDNSKRVQAQLVAKYLLHELYCIQLTDEAAVLEGRIRFSQAPFAAWRSRSSSGGRSMSQSGAQGAASTSSQGT